MVQPPLTTINPVDQPPTSEEAWQVILSRENMLWKHAHRRIRGMPPGVEKADVVSAARLHMHRLLQRWDKRRGLFLVYTNQCVAWSIGLAISEMVPANEARYGVIDTVCRDAWGRFKRREGRAPSAEELIVEVGPSPRMGRFTNGLALSRGQVNRWLTGSRPRSLACLDCPIPQSGGRLLRDVVPDGGKPLEEQLELRVTASQVEAVLYVLTDPQRYVWDRLSLGLPLADVGREMGVSRERVRQLRKDTLVRLRFRLGVEEITLPPYFFGRPDPVASPPDGSFSRA